MSASEDQIKKMIDGNPQVDEEQLDAMLRLHEKLERDGLEKPRYAIISPYERKPLRHAARRGWGSTKEDST